MYILPKFFISKFNAGGIKWIEPIDFSEVYLEMKFFDSFQNSPFLLPKRKIYLFLKKKLIRNPFGNGVTLIGAKFFYESS